MSLKLLQVGHIGVIKCTDEYVYLNKYISMWVKLIMFLEVQFFWFYGGVFKISMKMR